MTQRPETETIDVEDHRLILVDPEDYQKVSDDREIILFSIQSTNNNNKNSSSTSKPSCTQSRSICGICSDNGCTHSVSIERTADHAGGASFRVAIAGEFDRDALLNLASTIYDAAGEKAKGKGKEKLQFGESSVEEEEEDKLKKFYCGICMEHRPIADWFGVENCSHIFCAGCVGRYVAAKVEENLIFVGCPNPECRKGVLEPEFCRRIIPPDVFDRWGLALCESAIGANKFYCPYTDCSGPLIHDDDGVGGSGSGSGNNAGAITDAECPHCHRMFCAQCRVPWHQGIGCEEFQMLGKDERGREDLMLRQLAADKRWQRCPQCKMYVEKIEGCMFMTCRCGYCFCYRCGSLMSKENQLCTKCNS